MLEKVIFEVECDVPKGSFCGPKIVDAVDIGNLCKLVNYEDEKPLCVIFNEWLKMEESGIRKHELCLKESKTLFKKRVRALTIAI